MFLLKNWLQAIWQTSPWNSDELCVFALLPQFVDYKSMSADPAFERYSELAIQLQRVELLSLSREEKLAFFINIYNALVIHGNLRLGAPTNMWQRYRVWSRSCTYKHYSDA